MKERYSRRSREGRCRWCLWVLLHAINPNTDSWKSLELKAIAHLWLLSEKMGIKPGFSAVEGKRWTQQKATVQSSYKKNNAEKRKPLCFCSKRLMSFDPIFLLKCCRKPQPRDLNILEQVRRRTIIHCHTELWDPVFNKTHRFEILFF